MQQANQLLVIVVAFMLGSSIMSVHAFRSRFLIASILRVNLCRSERSTDANLLDAWDDIPPLANLDQPGLNPRSSFGHKNIVPDSKKGLLFAVLSNDMP